MTGFVQTRTRSLRVCEGGRARMFRNLPALLHPVVARRIWGSCELAANIIQRQHVQVQPEGVR